MLAGVVADEGDVGAAEEGLSAPAEARSRMTTTNGMQRERIHALQDPRSARDDALDTTSTTPHTRPA